MRHRDRNTDNSYLTKQALMPIFGKENVRVNRDRGTASGWITIYVQIPRPADCRGEQPEDGCPYRHEYHCQPCRETTDLTERIISKATAKIEYGSYCCDDGYGTERSQVNTSICFDGENTYKFGKDK